MSPIGYSSVAAVPSSSATGGLQSYSSPLFAAAPPANAASRLDGHLDLSKLMGPFNDPCMRHLRRLKRQRRTSSVRDQPFYNFKGTYRTGQLFCRTGFFLQVHDDGRINGTRREKTSFGLLEFFSVAIGLVSIRGKSSHNWLCMNSKGKLYGRSVHDNKECVFLEQMLENYYNTYASCAPHAARHGRKKRRWYVALSKKGRPRRGNKSRRRRKNAQFLVTGTVADDTLPDQSTQTADRWRYGSGRVTDEHDTSRFGTRYYNSRWREKLNERLDEILIQWKREGKVRVRGHRRRLRDQQRRKGRRRKSRHHPVV